MKPMIFIIGYHLRSSYFAFKMKKVSTAMGSVIHQNKIGAMTNAIKAVAISPFNSAIRKATTPTIANPIAKQKRKTVAISEDRGPFSFIGSMASMLPYSFLCSPFFPTF